MSKSVGHDPASGRFTPGNPGGPGRPPRATERRYLEKLADTITLDAWGKIVERAITDARAGDARAREWIAGYVLGSSPLSLTALAIREQIGIEAEHELAANVEIATTLNSADKLLKMIGEWEPGTFDRALLLATGKGRGES